MKVLPWNSQHPGCPNCGNSNIHRSRRNGPVEFILHWVFFITPYRCRECDVRHFRFRLGHHSGHFPAPASK
jgi:hypothetical protein